MSKRTRLTTTALVAVAAIAAAVTIPALTGAQTGPREITVRMKVRGGTEVKHGNGAKLAPGDALIIRLAMFSPDGSALGSAHAECVNVGRRANAGNATLQCVQTYKFKDGQIVTAGLVKFSALDDLAGPIVGGSGAYRGASGQVTGGDPVRGFDSVDVLQLDG